MSQGSAAKDNVGLRAVWTAVMTVVAAVTGIGAGLLSWLGGTNPPLAILAGFAAFAGALMLQVTVFSFVSGQPAGKDHS